MNAREPEPRLGRGLAALMGDAATPGSGAPGIRPITVASLEPGPFQPRGPIDRGSMAELVASVRARGILQPLLARPHPSAADRYQIIAGERRWRAAQEAGLHDVPVLVRDLSDADAMAAALVENLQRQDLNAIEEAEGYRRLLQEFGMTQDALGQAVGKSRSHVANTVRLLNLPPMVQAELRHGALSAGHARALLSHPQPEKAALAIIAQGLNVRQAEAMTQRAASRTSQTQAPARLAPAGKDPNLQALERDLSERLGLRVDIRFDGRGGSLRLSYRSLDQLDALVSLLGRD